MSRASRHSQPRSLRVDTTEAVSAFLHSLADRAQSDPAFAVHIHAALRESGLLSAVMEAPVPSAQPRRPARSTASQIAAPASSVPPTGAPALDPFTVLRQRGESGLRSALGDLDLAMLRQLVRVHRLDPARISARWSARDRVITLIVDQVRARADHGKAFSRV